MRHETVALRQAERELESALEEAARAADKHERNASIARRVYNARPELVRLLLKPWGLERMERMLEKLERHAPSDKQLTIPGIDLPPVIKLLKPDPAGPRHQKSQRIALLDCTLPQLREYRKELLKSLHSDKRIQEIEKAIAIMEKHAPRSKKATMRSVIEKLGQETFAFQERSVQS